MEYPGGLLERPCGGSDGYMENLPNLYREVLSHRNDEGWEPAGTTADAFRARCEQTFGTAMAAIPGKIAHEASRVSECPAGLKIG